MSMESDDLKSIDPKKEEQQDHLIMRQINIGQEDLVVDGKMIKHVCRWQGIWFRTWYLIYTSFWI